MALGDSKETHSPDMVEKLDHVSNSSDGPLAEHDNPNVHQHMNMRLFLSLCAMSFLWVGSQIPLYLYGAVLPSIYSDIGGADKYTWMVVAYLIPLSALCPFVGALSDMFGRKAVGAAGQILLMIGPVIVSTAKTMNTAIGGMVICGLGAGLNELIALAGTSELVPIKKRPAYVGAVVATILPFCPSALWAELINISDWRYCGVLIGVWNLIGLVLLMVFYKDPASLLEKPHTKSEILRKVDFVGALLSIAGVLSFMVGAQYGVQQYSWSSATVLAPVVVGLVLIIAFFVWEAKFAPFPMVPAKLFSIDGRTMALVLLITFFSGGNFFAVLLFWPTQAHNMYSSDPVTIGLLTLPVGFGIIAGAFICLILIGATKGRTTIIMIGCTVLMTAFTGAMAAARRDNLSLVLFLMTFASLSVGAVIIPISIVSQIICPVELIGSITAIGLSIRYIGGAIAFTAYYNVFYSKFFAQTTAMGLKAIVGGYVTGPTLIADTTEFITLAAQAQFEDLRHFIATNPNILKKDTAFDFVLNLTRDGFAEAYKWPYYISIAFGGVCIIAAFFMRDIREHM